MKIKIAKVVSTITNPPILCIPLFLLISYILAGNFNEFLLYESISLIFTSILPMAIILYWARKSGNDRDISNRRDRFTPLIVGSISYFIGFLTSIWLNTNIFLTVLLLCYSINTFIVMIDTIKWKISIHTTGLSGPVCALIILTGLPSALLGLIFPLLVWSRVTLKKHTMAQAVCGGIQGFILTAVEMYLIFSSYGIVLNIEPLINVLWFILAIVIIPAVLGVLSYIHFKIFYLLAILSMIVFTLLAPRDAFLILILSLVICILIAYLDEDFIWNSIIKKT